jgi:hypothetical protein
MRGLVQKHGAAFGHLQQSRPIAMRAGEAAPHVAEQLRLEQRLGDADAVDGHHRHVRPCAIRVDHPAGNLFAHAAFAGQQDLRVAACRVLDFDPQRVHGRTDTDQGIYTFHDGEASGRHRHLRMT